MIDDVFLSPVPVLALADADVCDDDTDRDPPASLSLGTRTDEADALVEYFEEMRRRSVRGRM